MANRNCSDGVDGFNFQTVASISLLIDNLDTFDYIRNEGSEDIVIKLIDGKTIYSQSKKSIYSDNPNAIRDLSKALESLSEHTDDDSYIELIFITNVAKMLGPNTDYRIFNSGESVNYMQLGMKNQECLDSYLRKYNNIEKDKFFIQYLEYSGNDDEKVQPVIGKMREYFRERPTLKKISARNVFMTWYYYLNRNQGEHDLSVVCSRKKITWGMIFYLIQTLKEDIYSKAEEDYTNIQENYEHIIESLSGRIEYRSRIIAEYEQWIKTQNRCNWNSLVFAENNWEKYLDVLIDYELDELYKKPVVICVIRSIIEENSTIGSVFMEMNINENNEDNHLAPY